MALKTKNIGGGRSAGKQASGHLERRAAVIALLGDTDDNDLLFVTGLAGSRSDVLEAVGADCKRVYPLSGAMGAATSMALGLALAQPDKRVICVTGDGELLMNGGTLATISILNPPNLAILCVDNEHYGETGFQRSHTGLGVELARIAEGCGIQAVRTVIDEADFDEAGKLLRSGNGAGFVLLKVGVSDPPGVTRNRDAVLNKAWFREAVLGKA